jgi:hypothetical protein
VGIVLQQSTIYKAGLLCPSLGRRADTTIQEIQKKVIQSWVESHLGALVPGECCKDIAAKRASRSGALTAFRKGEFVADKNAVMDLLTDEIKDLYSAVLRQMSQHAEGIQFAAALRCLSNAASINQ